MKYNGERSPDEIEAEIERTRADMDATLRAIEGRLTPGELVDQGIDYLRHSGANEFLGTLGSQVKHNPLPVTLAGLGIAWLMMASRHPSDAASPAGITSSSGLAGARTTSGPTMSERAGEAMNRLAATGQRTSDAMHRVGGTVQAAGERLTGTVHAAGERLTATTQAARESMAHAASAARQSAAQMSETARRQAERIRHTYAQVLDEQPLALGAVGLAVGAMLAATLPRTRREDQLMGEARDRLAEQAMAVGREQLHKAERVAAAATSAATSAAAEEAKRQGLAPVSEQEQRPAQEAAGTTRITGSSATTESGTSTAGMAGSTAGAQFRSGTSPSCPATDPTPPGIRGPSIPPTGTVP